MKNELECRDQLFSEYSAGDARGVFETFDKLQATDKVFLACRVSYRDRDSNLQDHEANLRNAVIPTGAEIVGVHSVTLSGWNPAAWLPTVMRKARAAGATVVLFESTDRAVRNRWFRCDRPYFTGFQATDKQLTEVAVIAGGMRLMTHLNASATPSQVMSYQRKRGQRYKNKKGGRPKNRTAGYMTRRHGEKIGLVMFLHQRGWSVRRIANKPMVSVPKSTVSEWIAKAI